MANEFTGILEKVSRTATADKTMRTALTTVLAVHKKRIFEEGFNANGVKIGTYSTKPTSIAKSEQARNTGKTYFAGGYSEYKKAVGKNPGYVILRNTDQMMSDYNMVGSGDNWGFGFQNTVNYRKSQNLELKYQAPIFELSRNEESILADALVDQLIKSI